MRGPIVFCADPISIEVGIGVGVNICDDGIVLMVSCVHDISSTDWQIFIKFAWIYHWDMPSS